MSYNVIRALLVLLAIVCLVIAAGNVWVVLSHGPNAWLSAALAILLFGAAGRFLWMVLTD